MHQTLGLVENSDKSQFAKCASLLYHVFDMQVHNLVSLNEVVNALNVQPPNIAEDVRFAEAYAAAAGHLPRKETRSFTASWLSHKLRRYVDEWLQTGRQADGREFPRNRKLRGESYLVVAEYLEQYPPAVGVSSAEGVTILFGDPKGHPVGPGKLYEAVEREAQRLFAGLMVNEQRPCLCKCPYAGCGRYFLLHKPRQVYKRGAFCCRTHQMMTRAKVLTRNRRLQATEELIELAARQLVSWKAGTSWAADGKQKRRLADALSQQIRHKPNLKALRPVIRINWVTRYRQRIEQNRYQLARK